MKSPNQNTCLAAFVACLAPTIASAALIEIDESNFIGWTPGAAHQTAATIYEEELNLPAVRSLGANILGAPAPTILHLSPEGPLTPMDIEYNLHLSTANLGGIGNGNVFGRKFNIYDPLAEGGALSDTLTVTFTGLPGNEVDVNLHFFSNPEPGLISPLTGTLGVDLFNINDRLNSLFGLPRSPGIRSRTWSARPRAC